MHSNSWQNAWLRRIRVSPMYISSWQQCGQSGDSLPGAIPHLRARKKGKKTFYYYDHGGKPRREEPLGSDYGLAIVRWAEIQRAGAEKPAAIVTFGYVATRYLAEVVPTKAPRTQRDNLRELERLKAYFEDPPCPLDSIEPQHVKA